jgi:Na+-transporting methylmalonyl-CoA/oxaloacetate decarboxylase gamma subunit
MQFCRTWHKKGVTMGENVMYALEIMGKGMASIFVVIILLTLIVMLMAKIGESSTKNKGQNNQE